MEELTEEEKKYAFQSKAEEAIAYGRKGCRCKNCCLIRFHKDWNKINNLDIYDDLVAYLHNAKKTISIKDIAEKRYKIKFVGNKTKCPFHNDSDPSFVINEEENIFQCWGSTCGIRGDVIDFIELMEKKNERK